MKLLTSITPSLAAHFTVARKSRISPQAVTDQRWRGKQRPIDSRAKPLPYHDADVVAQTFGFFHAMCRQNHGALSVGGGHPADDVPHEASRDGVHSRRWFLRCDIMVIYRVSFCDNTFSGDTANTLTDRVAYSGHVDSVYHPNKLCEGYGV